MASGGVLRHCGIGYDLLILMVVLSVAFAVLFAFWNWLASALLSLVSILLLVALTTCVVYGRGHIRAFCMGAMFPAVLVAIVVACWFVVITFTMSRDRYDRIIEGLDESAGGLRFASITGWLMAVAAGTMSFVVSRRLTRGRDGGCDSADRHRSAAGQVRRLPAEGNCGVAEG